VRGNRAQLIADEVLTGFGRAVSLSSGSELTCGLGKRAQGGVKKSCPADPQLFASHSEGVQPDLLALAKGLTGGYLPMAATLTTQEVFESFLGDYSEFKTFFHGHSYTGNQLGAAAACASLDILNTQSSRTARMRLERALRQALTALWPSSIVGDIRQVGLIVGIELVRDWRTREPFELRERAGMRICELMARRGVLTRPIGNVIVLMPPYCTTGAQVRRMVQVLQEALAEFEQSCQG
jgi:adenosylmethionine-8-amino-7-oxononanoate aminotransferase